MSQSHVFSMRCPYGFCSYNRWPPGHTLEPHSHDFLQVFHLLEGDSRIDMGGGWQTVRPGSVHVLPPGFQHAFQAGSGDLHVFLNLQPEDDERGWRQRLAEHFRTPTVYATSFPAALHRFLESRPLVLTEAAELKLINLFDAYCLSLIEGHDQARDKGTRLRLLDFLELNAHVPLTVEQIANAVPMSRASLQRFCSKVFGCGAHALHHRVRMERAARLLLQSDLSVSRCASQCGFPDIYSFSRSFKRIMGSSPLAFRRARRLSE